MGKNVLLFLKTGLSQTAVTDRGWLARGFYITARGSQITISTSPRHAADRVMVAHFAASLAAPPCVYRREFRRLLNPSFSLPYPGALVSVLKNFELRWTATKLPQV